MTIPTSLSSRAIRAACAVLCATSSALAFQKPTSTGGTPRQAPEINPAFIVGAVVLIVGCILILTSRRRRIAKV